MVFQRLKTYVIEHQLSYEPSLDTELESSFGEYAANHPDDPIINDSEPEEESVGENSPASDSAP